MADDLYLIVISTLCAVPILGTLLDWYREAMWHRMIRESDGSCPSCRHPEHWPWCRECGCDLFTEPEAD